MKFRVKNMEHLKLRMFSGGKKHSFEKDMLVKSGESSIYPKDSGEKKSNRHICKFGKLTCIDYSWVEMDEKGE